MNGQMTIFEFLKPSYPDINNIPETEAVKIVGEAISVKFVWNEFFEHWQGKKGKMKLDMKYDRFSLNDNNDLFLGVGYDIGTSGGGAPCDSIESAIQYFRAQFERYKI